MFLPHTTAVPFQKAVPCLYQSPWLQCMHVIALCSEDVGNSMRFLELYDFDDRLTSTNDSDIGDWKGTHR